MALAMLGAHQNLLLRLLLLLLLLEGRYVVVV
jgi:hypothetical protein